MLKTKVPRTETHAIEWLGLHCGLSYGQGHKRIWGLEMQLTVEGAHLGPLGT